VLYVYEASATSPNNGAALGAIHGADAKRQLEALGQPYSVPFLAAFDTNTTAANIANHVAYYNAFAAAAAPYFVGVYADTDLGAAVDEAIGWLPLAWSWSGSSKADAEAKARALGYHVLQLKGFYIDNTWAVDPNVAIRPITTWGIASDVPAPTPSEEDEDMKVVSNAEPRAWAGTQYQANWIKYIVMDNGTVRRVTGTELKARGWDGVTQVLLSNAELDELGEYVEPLTSIPPITVPAPVVTLPKLVATTTITPA
jgi:hypothetical protein